ncbi:MAG: YesL family protein [Johnsonella sp.]|nr:YesL family protein [Johnsonella sp.]
MFEFNHKWNVYLSKVYDFFLLNMLWLLCSLPIVTMGAANTAIYYVSLKMAEKREGNIVRSYFYSFRQNLKQGILLQILFNILLLPLLYFVRLSEGEKEGSLIRWICILSAVFLVLIFSYAYPLLARFDNTIKNTLINAAKLAVLYPGVSLRMLMLNLSPLVFFVFFTKLFLRSLLLWAAFGFALIAYLNSLMLCKLFKDLLPEEEEEKKVNAREE